MKHLALFLASMLLALSGFSQSALQKVHLRNGFTDVKIHQDSFGKIFLHSYLNDLTFSDVVAHGGLFTSIQIPDYVSSHVVGNPQLPIYSKLIEVPLDAQIKVKVLNKTFHEYDLSSLGIQYDLTPVQGSSRKQRSNDSVFSYNQKVYQQNQFLSALPADTSQNNIVRVEYLGIMRGVALARIEISPLHYNPAQRSIKVYDDLSIEIDFINADINKTNALKAKTASPYFDQNYRKAINHDKLPQALGEQKGANQAPVKYVIVSDSIFRSTLQPLVEWKKKKGFNVIEAYTQNPAVGNTNTSIKAYLQSLYDNATPADPAPTFILLIGDIAQLPTFYPGKTDYHVTDLYYAEYTGDFMPEAFYGRFSVTNQAQLKAQIDKTLEYEQYQMPDPSYLKDAILIAGIDNKYADVYGNGQINYAYNNYINPAHGFVTHMFPYPESATQASNIIQLLNQGVGFFNYTGHGTAYTLQNPALTITNIKSLTNAGKYPLIVINACQVNEFNVDESFGEAITRADHAGAIGCVGASNQSDWDEDYYWAVGYQAIVKNPAYSPTSLGAYDKLFHNHGEPQQLWATTQDQIIFAGNMAVMESGSSDYDLYWEIYHLLGDPSLMPYLAQPTTMHADFQPLLPLGVTTFSIHAEPNSYVALSRNNILYGAGFVDSTGHLELNIQPFSTSGYADIVITKQNRQPLFDSIFVDSPVLPYVLYDSYTIADSTGNHNSQADAGETVTLNVSLKNFGLQNDTLVTANLSTTDSFISLLDTTKTWALIAAQDTATKNNAFTFVVDSAVPDQHIAEFILHITDHAGRSWISKFTTTVNAPAFTCGKIIVNDSILGNADGRLDPNESATVKIYFTNTGHSDAIHVHGALSIEDSNIHLDQTTFTKDTLKVGSTTAIVFPLSVSSNAVAGAFSTAHFQIESAATPTTKDYILSIGYLTEDFESGIFPDDKLPWDTTQIYPWEIDTIIFYQGQYALHSAMIPDNEESMLSIKYHAVEDDSISFYRKVYSELQADYLQFYIDDHLMEQWSGDENWKRVAYPVQEGNHIFQWVYQKDVSFSIGQDRAWVDNIVFPTVKNYDLLVHNQSLGLTTSINIFPNPTSNQINIENAEQSMINSVSITDLQGRVVYLNSTAFTGNTTVDVSSLAKGMYLIALKSGAQLLTKKLMIQ